MFPQYKHSLKCIQVNLIKSSIKGILEGNEDSISHNDNLKLRYRDVCVWGGWFKRNWNPISPDTLNTSESCLLKWTHRSVSGNFHASLGLHSSFSSSYFPGASGIFSPLNYGFSQSTKSGVITSIAINQIGFWVGTILKRRNVSK